MALRFNTTKPQAFRDIGGESVCLYRGRCQNCNRRVYGLEGKPGTGLAFFVEPDPRGMIGRAQRVRWSLKSTTQPALTRCSAGTASTSTAAKAMSRVCASRGRGGPKPSPFLRAHVTGAPQGTDQPLQTATLYER